MSNIMHDDDEKENFNAFVFEEKEDENCGDDEEDAKILDMTLIKSILGNAGGDDPEKVQESRKVSFRDVGSLGSSLDEEEMTHEQLVNKLGGLQAKLTQLSIDISAEKAMRHKKDKSLVKLAKELNKRAADQTAKEKKINLVRCDVFESQLFHSIVRISHTHALRSNSISAQRLGRRPGSQACCHSIRNGRTHCDQRKKD